MAASPNLPHPSAFRKSPISKTGVLTLVGFGIRVRMQAGHLEIEDGIGPDRRKLRLARVGHGLKRLVLIGSDGFVTLEALRWLGDQDAAFVMLDRDGSVLLTTGPTYPSDARLRRAQAISTQSDVALQIALELIDKKLAGQEHVARQKLGTEESADTIRCYRSELAEADSIERVRSIEASAAIAYWSAWRSLPIRFPRRDEQRIPEHWRVFGARMSPLTSSPRLAINPPNAMLNYLYAVLESEASLAAAAVGLDPGLGVLHRDSKVRNSLACDLMEPIRAKVDSYVYDWITRDLLKREWFSEQRDGNCRLMASLAAQLSDTAPMWRREVAPLAEWIAGRFLAPAKKRDSHSRVPTRLTQQHKREAKGAEPLPAPIPTARRQNACQGCGKTIDRQFTHCRDCAKDGWSKKMVDVARVGRLTANSAEALAKRRNTQRRIHAARLAWNPASQPAWLTEQFFAEQVKPLLAQASNGDIAMTIGVSRPYAAMIRKGYRPHPRHWQRLSRLVGITSIT